MVASAQITGPASDDVCHPEAQLTTTHGTDTGAGLLQISLPHQARLRSAPPARSRLRCGRRSCLRPAPPALPRAPMCERGRLLCADHRTHLTGQIMPPAGRSGSEMEGAPYASAGGVVACAGAPIPPAIDPGRAEQTRPMASRSFVQWRAPPGRHGPRPLHGVWVDGRRDGS